VLLKIQSYWDESVCCWTGKLRRREKRERLQNTAQYFSNNRAYHHLHQVLRELDCSTTETKALWPLKNIRNNLSNDSAISQNAWIFSNTSLRPSNLTTSAHYRLESRVVARVLPDVYKDNGGPWRKAAMFLPHDRASRPTGRSAVPLRKRC